MKPIHWPLMSRMAVVLLLVLSSCASHQYFRPRESSIVESPAGYPAAQYALGEVDNRVGRINVWSRGAEVVDRDDGTWTVIHLGLEITNTSQGVLAINVEEVELRSITIHTQRIDVLNRSVHTGLAQVPAEQVGRLDFEFFVEPDLDPTSIGSFAARWVVQNEEGGVYRNLTLFQEVGYYGYGYWGYGYWGTQYGRYGWGSPYGGYGWYPW